MSIYGNILSHILYLVVPMLVNQIARAWIVTRAVLLFWLKMLLDVEGNKSLRNGSIHLQNCIMLQTGRPKSEKSPQWITYKISGKLFYLYKHNQQAATLDNGICYYNALHVSGGSSAHHQELKSVYTAFTASYRKRYEAVKARQIPDAVYTVLSSWTSWNM